MFISIASSTGKFSEILCSVAFQVASPHHCYASKALAESSEATAYDMLPLGEPGKLL